MNKWIEAPERSRDSLDMDAKSYTLIRVDNARIEVRIVKIQPEHLEGKFSSKQEILADYHGKNPENLYYKIIADGWITKLQHAAYLGKELYKASVALRLKINYVQDEELDI